MKSIVCTLFEGNYHYGVAGLINSLIKSGFQGDFYIGYKGSLPKWAEKINKNNSLVKGCNIHFNLVNTTYHLTNYKPDFLLEVLKLNKEQVSNIFYIDPDIILKAPWNFMEEWVKCGVAVCEDILSPLEKFHPRRTAWRNYFAKHNFTLIFKNNIYVNGGFLGLSSENFHFLNDWKDIQEAMAIKIGGLNVSSLTGNTLPKVEQGSFAYFSKTDQDALNAAIELTKFNISYMGKDAMGFLQGRMFLPHALGQPKPWNWNPLLQSLHGKAPTMAVKEYWKFVNAEIITHSTFSLITTSILLKFSSFIGRFYKK